MPVAARIVLFTASALITLGGFYDVFTPRLPANLIAHCGGDERACRLARELLRALGAALVAIGLAVAVLVATSGADLRPVTLVVILLLVVPSEGVNAFCMRRANSPFYVPLGFALLALLGVLLAWPGTIR